MKKVIAFVKSLLRVLFFLLLVVFIRMFVFEVCYIPSNSMEDTIMAGDRLVIGKLRYGGLLPRRIADVPLINILTLSKYLRENDRCRDWGYGRAPALISIKRGDVIVFNYPKEAHVRMVKRCVALPGDTIRIEKGLVFINRRRIEFPATVILPEPQDKGNMMDFPCKSLGWTSNDYGPVAVPSKGMTITLDSTSLELYRNMIRIEGHEAFIWESEIYIDGVKATGYTFKTDGYFALGDNRGNSLDSRYWGIISERLIIGKAALVYFSRDATMKKVRWKRIGKVLE